MNGKWVLVFVIALLGAAAPLQSSVSAAEPAQDLSLTGGLLPEAAAPDPEDAGVTRFVVNQRRPFAEGRNFGQAGPYERLDATAYVEVDPRDPRNSVIVNLDRAPRNARGMVEYSTPVFILKPMDMARSNGKLFYGINNRGNKQTLGYFNFVPNGPGINDPVTATDAGDGFLMRLGYTVVDAGWQGDVAPTQNRLAPMLPVATQADGSPVTARVRTEYSDRTIPESGTFTLTLEGDPSFRSYETAVTNTAQSTLTVRDSPDGPRTPIGSERWAFGSCPNGQASLVPSTTDICLFDGFRSDRLYELIYTAKNPLVMGLGYAVTRDIASFLRYQVQDREGNPNPLARSATETAFRHAYSFGSSSTGMYQRDWLYLGFNDAGRGRKTFDAVWIHKPGSHRLFANVEFADPNTYSRQDDRQDFVSTSSQPMSLAVTTDPISGIRDGILKRPATDPLVFQTDTENEFWEMKASLNVADGVASPITMPDNARLYLLSNFQHSGNTPPASFPGPAGMCLYPTNPNYHGPTVRALLMDLDAWADGGLPPPPSNYPRVEDGTLVEAEQLRPTFSAFGVHVPLRPNELQLLDYGPLFSSIGGRLTVLPPLHGPAYRVLVPQVNGDGLDIAGIRPIEVRAPLGTNLGWNLRRPGQREGYLCGLSGSFVPFAATRAERLATGDSRQSLEERYRDHAGYVQAVISAAHELVQERFLVPEDADRFAAEAESASVLR